MSTEPQNPGSPYSATPLAGASLSGVDPRGELALSDLFDPFQLVSALTQPLSEIKPMRITSDSRAVIPGTLFVAIRGDRFDGHDFIDVAHRQGAIAVVSEERLETAIPLPTIQVRNIRETWATLVSRSLHCPSASLRCVAVTGTNGKTSVSWIVAQALARLGGKTLMIGTLGSAFLGERGVEGASVADLAVEDLAVEGRADSPLPRDCSPEFTDIGNTTPGPERTGQLLKDARDSGAFAAVLEATSIGLIQHRTTGTEWDVAVFTNLTRDHLDVHETMEAYGAAKELLFSRELVASRKAVRTAILNVDDPFGAVLRGRSESWPGIRLLTYSATDRSDVDVRLLQWQPSITGSVLFIEFENQPFTIHSRLVGAFNVSNTLASFGALAALGFEPAKIVDALSQVPPVSGRLEVISVGAVQCIVDYSHTPDALVQAQRSLLEIITGRLITVFGCGGNRDRGKRPLMGAAVASLSDVAIVTSDNPRNEDPKTIIADIVPGVLRALAERKLAANSETQENDCQWYSEVDRAAAIRLALKLAHPGDTVLIAGKGHEDYQEIAGVKHPFSDQQICRDEAVRHQGA